MGTMETRTLRVLSGRDQYPLPADSDHLQATIRSNMALLGFGMEELE